MVEEDERGMGIHGGHGGRRVGPARERDNAGLVGVRRQLAELRLRDQRGGGREPRDQVGRQVPGQGTEPVRITGAEVEDSGAETQGMLDGMESLQHGERWIVSRRLEGGGERMVAT